MIQVVQLLCLEYSVSPLKQQKKKKHHNYLIVLVYNCKWKLKILLTGTIWKCFIFNPWLNDSTNVLGLLWLSRTKNTLKKIENFQIKITVKLL